MSEKFGMCFKKIPFSKGQVNVKKNVKIFDII